MHASLHNYSPLHHFENNHCLQLSAAKLAAKIVGKHSTISALSSFAFPSPYNVDLLQDVGPITYHWGALRFTLCHIFKTQRRSGGRGYRFPLRGDFFRGPLKGKQCTFTTTFCCVLTNFGNYSGFPVINSNFL